MQCNIALDFYFCGIFDNLDGLYRCVNWFFGKNFPFGRQLLQGSSCVLGTADNQTLSAACRQGER